MENQLLIDKQIIMTGIIAATTLSICVVIGTVLVIKWNSKVDIEQGAKAIATIYDKLNVLETMTVLTIIASLLLLALTEKLSSGAVSILSGVAGYVLGSLARKERKKEPSEEEEELKA